MIQELESVTLLLGKVHDVGVEQHGLVVGLKTPDGYVIERILYHKHTGQIQIETVGGVMSFNQNETKLEIGGHVRTCRVIIGNGKTIRPDAPPPLKRRQPTGFYNPITGESFKVEQAYQKSQTENLPLHSLKKEIVTLREYLTESERKNKVLTEKLDSMRKAYHAEADENARLKQNMPVPYESHEVVIDDVGNEIERYSTNDITRMLSNAKHHNEITINNLQRELKIERQITGELNEQTRKKVIAWGICLTTAQIVQVVFNYLI